MELHEHTVAPDARSRACMAETLLSVEVN